MSRSDHVAPSVAARVFAVFPAVAIIFIALALVSCSNEPDPEAPKLKFAAIEMRDSVPVVAGDVAIELITPWKGRQIIEVATDEQYLMKQDSPLGEFRGGEIFEGRVIPAYYFRRRGEGQYWARGGVFSGERDFGFLVSLVEMPIDKRSGYLFRTEEMPGGVVRNRYGMGGFQPLIWEDSPDTPSVLGGPLLLFPPVQASTQTFAFALPHGFRAVSAEKLPTLEQAMRAGATALANESGLAGAPAHEAGRLDAFESANGRYTILFRKSDEPVAITQQGVLEQNLKRVNWGKQSGNLAARSRVIDDLEIAGQPTILSEIFMKNSGDLAQSYDVFVTDPSSNRHTIMIFHSGPGFDQALIERFLRSIELLAEHEARPADRD